MKGIIYTRVSGDDQIQNTSLSNQEELCRNYCTQKGIEVVGLFREEGETAKDLSLNNRKKFLEALEFCRKNKIEAFVVLRVDRFARNTDDHFAVRKILLGYGTNLHSVTEPIGNQPSEKFIETVLAGAAEYENAIRKQRCTDGMSQKINQGIYPWKPPFGYKPANTKKRGEKKTIPDPPDEVLFPITQRGLKEYAHGLCSISELARLLDTWGLAEVRGKPTIPQFVDRMLSEHLRFYAGILYNPWTKKEVEGIHKPMITKEEYYKILAIRAGTAIKKSPRGTFNVDFPLRKTVMCGSCNRPLTGSYSSGHGGRYPYYHCYSKSCPYYGKSIDKMKIESDFMDYLKRIKPHQKFINLFKETVIDLWQEKGKVFESMAKRYSDQLQSLEEKRKRIYEMREDGSYSKEEFQERKSEIENTIATVRISLNESRIEQLDVEGALAYATHFIANLDRQWFDIQPELRPRFQKLLFPEGISFTKINGFGTPKLGLIFEVIEDFSIEKSRVVDHAGIDWNQLLMYLKEWKELQLTV